MTASASSTDSTIKNVSWYVSGDGLSNYKLATVSTSPYKYQWVGVNPNSFTITAQALAANGHTVDSTPVAFTIVQDVPPVVTVTSPANGTVFASKSTVALAATATSTYSTINSVSFYNGTTLLKTVTVAPYTYSWKPASGSYSITAVSSDAAGLSTTSSAVAITVK